MLVSACEESNSSLDWNAICGEVDCSGHGTCVITQENQPACLCDANYHSLPSDPTQCVTSGAQTGTCDKIDCDGHGTCTVTGENKVQCVCDPGYRNPASDITLIHCESSSDQCQGVDCSQHGTCVLEGEAAVCQCETGYHTASGDPTKCEEDSCDSVTCSGHGTCEMDSTYGTVHGT